MKRLLAAAGAIALMPLASCVADGYYAGGYAGEPIGYTGFYDDYYGPIYDGYWGTDGAFYYRSAEGGRFRRGDGAHFRRGDAGPGGFHGDHGHGGNFHEFHGTFTPPRGGARMPHFGGGMHGGGGHGHGR